MEQFHASIKKYLLIGIIIALFILVIVYVYRRKKEQIKGAAILGINRMMKLLKSRRRTGIFIVCTVVITLVLSVLLIEVIQSLLTNEFQEFDETMTFLVPSTFGQEWTPFMQVFSFMDNSKVLFIICACSFLWIIWKGKNKVLELLAWLLIISGGELYEESLIRLFHSLTLPEQTSAEHLFYKFPSEQPLMAFVIYGFAAFVFVRYTRKARVHSNAAAGTLLLLLLIAVSRIFFGVQDPSDILVEYIFGGVWLGLNILVLEMFRVLRNVHISLMKST